MKQQVPFDANSINVLALERQRSQQSTPNNSQLPPSRGSTASLHSAHSSQHHQQQHQQQIHQHQGMAQVTSAAHFQPINNQYQGMEALMRSAPDFAAQMDPSYPNMVQGQHPHMQPHLHQHQPSQSQQNIYYNPAQQAYNPNAQPLNHYADPSLPPPTAPHIASALEEDRKRKAANANAANDRELREMLRLNETRHLPDVAKEVILNERTAKAEKTKQLFAMLWLRKSCRTAKTSVPRGRVYATYVSRCGNERVQPLNPASFGKLVRVIFPGIQTRRLGVRGESKYHYVDLALVEDVQDNADMARPRHMSMSVDIRDVPPPPPSARPEQIDFSAIPKLSADTTLLGDDMSLGSPILPSLAPTGAEGRVFVDHLTPGFKTPGVTTSNSYEQALVFSVNNQEVDSHQVDLPDIWLYASPKMDVDAANTLKALYRSHCTSLIDCVRYCKEKQFFRLFTTLSGALTVPVQKLFLHPDLAAWIRECDWIMYQKMIQCVAHLTLQVVPPVVVKFLDTVSRNLHSHIRKTFASLPKHTLEAKLEPATLFSNLLNRMNRVNQTAHAAANVLESTDLRDQMWRDWVQLVNPKRIMESELPNCGYEEVYQILTRDIRSILQPSFIDLSLEAGTHFQGTSIQAPLYEGLDTVVDRLAVFLETLPSRFPQASARKLMSCISNLGSAALRDITINGGPSFNCWWLTKVFLDEMSHWLAALGGFMEHEAPLKSGDLSPSLSLPGTNGQLATIRGAEADSQSHSRYSSVDINGQMNQPTMLGQTSRQPSTLRSPTLPPSSTSQPQSTLTRPPHQNGVHTQQQTHLANHRHIDSATPHLAEQQHVLNNTTNGINGNGLTSDDSHEIGSEAHLEMELNKHIQQIQSLQHSVPFDDSVGMSFSTSSFESGPHMQMQQPMAQQQHLTNGNGSIVVHQDDIDDSGICMEFSEDVAGLREAATYLLNKKRKRGGVDMGEGRAIKR